MANQKVLEYVKSLLSQGYHIEDIEKRLTDAGWTREQIEECIDVIYESRPEHGGAPGLPETAPSTKPRIKSNFPTIIKPRLREDVYKPQTPPGPPAQIPAKPQREGVHFMENKLLVAGIVIVAVAVIALVAGILLFFGPVGVGEIIVTGLDVFEVPEDGALYAGATGNFRLTLKSINKTLVVEKIDVKVNGVAGTTSPDIMMNPGSKNNFLISDLPVLYTGQVYTAAVDVNYKDVESGMEFVSSGTVTGRVS